MAEIIAGPIMKWAGGKTQMLDDIKQRMPRSFNKYIEPFFGGGALFFNLAVDNAIIADSNSELINMYMQVMNNCDEVISLLNDYRNDEDTFYKVRALDWMECDVVEAAARTLYLNHTCFNGLYRLNKQGKFNTPFGRYTNPTICNEEKQAEEWEEIYEYMNLLLVNNGREKELGDDYIIKVPKSEAAAYLEWTLWRAFLAIDHTTNKPYESRGFNIDQDYMPVSTAPGGGPDMIFEFDNYIIVVEVTMSTNSRQETMEGEPVRRHVADLVMESEKPVYGVFIANKIDSNTAETFRIGCWYNQNDEKLALRIVPFTLTQFARYFNYMFCSKQANPDKFLELFNVCFSAKDGLEGPSWKREIESIVLEKANV